MRATFIALIGTMLGVGTALAEDNSACAVAQSLVHADFALPHVANAIHEQRLEIAVVGSGSSARGGGGGGKARRIQQGLRLCSPRGSRTSR
jgi:hypothetical protein